MTDIFAKQMGRMDSYPIVFGHGWGRDHTDFVPIAELVARAARVVLLDFPGFGNSPRPRADWGTNDYADAVKAHLADKLGLTRYIWVGHSFGGRVGLRLAAMTNSPIEHLFVVAGAGVKRPRPLTERLHSRLRAWAFQRKKLRAQTEEAIIDLEKRFGSYDYVRSRELGLRDIFLKTVQEDQSDCLSAIKCPTTLIYGGRDTETPTKIGLIMHQMIAHSKFLECPEFDHLSILSRGRYQVATMLLEELPKGDA